MILHGDSINKLKELRTNSIDAVITDPPYGYSFMGKDWDKAVPNVEIWQECLRVLKPGAFCMVMSAPRSDVQMHMISNLEQAGFRIDFTPIYWTYASGFPKAGNVAKLVDKRLGVEPIKTTAKYNAPDLRDVGKKSKEATGIDKLSFGQVQDAERLTVYNTEPGSEAAKALDGSYTGFQPKPAVEVIIVAMKPLSEKTYVDQALKNCKGITWLDDCRIPHNGEADQASATPQGKVTSKKGHAYTESDSRAEFDRPDTSGGRFPANLLVSDDVLNDGVERKPSFRKGDRASNKDGIVPWNKGRESGRSVAGAGYTDGGGFSRYFDLDKWASTLPFLIVPKASKSEKNKGLENLPAKDRPLGISQWKGQTNGSGEVMGASQPQSNHHPTVKPLRLMSYLITLTTREGDTVLDPFCGSGTTCIASKQLKREYIGIEREAEYVEIAEARLGAVEEEKQAVLL